MREGVVEGVVKAVAVAKRVDRRIELFMFCESESKRDWSMLAGQENRVEEQGEWLHPWQERLPLP